MLGAAAVEAGPPEVDYVCLLGTKRTGESEIADLYAARAQRLLGRAGANRRSPPLLGGAEPGPTQLKKTWVTWCK